MLLLPLHVHLSSASGTRNGRGARFGKVLDPPPSSIVIFIMMTMVVIIILTLVSFILHIVSINLQNFAFILLTSVITMAFDLDHVESVTRSRKILLQKPHLGQAFRGG